MTLVESHGLANRPGEPYPATFRICQWSHRELNPDFQSAELVSSRWTMAPSVVSFPFEPTTVSHLLFILCLETAFRVAHPPMGRTHGATYVSATFASSSSSSAHSGPPGSRTPITWVQTKRPPIERAALCLRGPSGTRTRSSALPRRRAASTPTDRHFSDPGWNRTITFLAVTQASSPLDHGIVSSDRGRSRTCKITRLSTSSLCLFAYSAVAGPGVAPGRRGL